VRPSRLAFARRRYIEVLEDLYPAFTRPEKLEVKTAEYDPSVVNKRLPFSLLRKLTRDTSEKALVSILETSSIVRTSKRFLTVQYANISPRLRLASLIYVVSTPTGEYKRKVLLVNALLDTSEIVPLRLEAEFILTCLDELAERYGHHRKAILVNPAVALKWIIQYTPFMREFPENFHWFKPTSWLLYTPRETPSGTPSGVN